MKSLRRANILFWILVAIRFLNFGCCATFLTMATLGMYDYLFMDKPADVWVHLAFLAMLFSPIDKRIERKSKALIEQMDQLENEIISDVMES